MSGGLLVAGLVLPVDGVTIIGPHDAVWANLSPGDYVARTIPWIRQWILHKTIADDPEHVIAGAGPAGAAQRTAEGWRNEFAGSHRYAGAHVVTGHDGITACLADLLFTETFHATSSNPWSVGHETCEVPGGGVYQAALEASVKVCIAGCRMLGIQLQTHDWRKYTGHPLERMLHGGPDMVGIFGHRDNTERRGMWDPGNIIFEMLADNGVEVFNFAAGEDRNVWSVRQEKLGVTPDGVPGPKTTSALREAGYRDGIYALGRRT